MGGPGPARIYKAEPAGKRQMRVPVVKGSNSEREGKAFPEGLTWSVERDKKWTEHLELA